ncbi:uncharacterized protein LOC112551653 [Alligator sinensis]|uniref:Uncharacterized protein LOC112551653 n=1 Tax=Alligator sinensis TaxID=38654 RepID=A0A3Q0HCP0_ALLSI|nr:uncharacterized protein LOC112551653 [Alligator sinensis]XP_025069400.1 uncharacterized protein LOC112551653 [Alligator sinensis]XP_025069401.1 uncharacterized protein LOC112551653 [Alligator sinensis]XP_025069402.1 uncharacterized protein LOC112551653 [Alligator sinensis]
MAPANILGQDLQVLTQILVSQQQMMDRQQDWLRHSLASFKMLKMTRDDDPKAYIEAFEHHALMTGLDKGYWASQLGALVVGKAQAAYRALARDDTRDYERVKAAMLYRLEIDPEHYRQLFQAKKGPDERRLRVLLQLLLNLLDKWVSPVGHNREALADQILLKQFQNDLEERTQRWVRQHSPCTCKVALKLAETFAASEVSYPQERRNPGPLAVALKEPECRPNREATKDTVCFQCGRNGHFSREYPSQPTERWLPADRLRVQMERRRDPESSDPMDCSYAVGEEGAIWSCPVIKAWVEGRPIQATLDSGCAQSLVRADLVQPQGRRKAIPAKVACLHGEAKQIERQWIHLRVMEHQGELLVGIVPHLVCEMLLGWD